MASSRGVRFIPSKVGCSQPRHDFFSWFAHFMVQICHEIYEYRTVNSFLILSICSRSNLRACFYSRAARTQGCCASRLLNPNNRSLHHRIVRTLFAVGVRHLLEPFTSTWPSFKTFQNEVVQMNLVVSKRKFLASACLL